MSTAEQLVRENWRLVPHTIQRYFPYKGNEWDDLISVGLIGLWRAARKYDASRAQFSTWAVIKIRSEMQRYLRKHWKHWNQQAFSLETILWTMRRTRTTTLCPTCPLRLKKKWNSGSGSNSF